MWIFSLRFLLSETMSENDIFNIGEIKIPYRVLLKQSVLFCAGFALETSILYNKNYYCYYNLVSYRKLFYKTIV